LAAVVPDHFVKDGTPAAPIPYLPDVASSKVAVLLSLDLVIS